MLKIHVHGLARKNSHRRSDNNILKRRVAQMEKLQHPRRVPLREREKERNISRCIRRLTKYVERTRFPRCTVNERRVVYQQRGLRARARARYRHVFPARHRSRIRSPESRYTYLGAHVRRYVPGTSQTQNGERRCEIQTRRRRCSEEKGRQPGSPRRLQHAARDTMGKDNYPLIGSLRARVYTPGFPTSSRSVRRGSIG